MNLAHDVFAESNPAYIALTLAAFSATYCTANEEGPELVLSYLVVPLALSSDIDAAFSGTNKNTGFMEWVNRNPGLLVSISERVDMSLHTTSEGLRYGILNSALRADDKGHIFSELNLRTALLHQGDLIKASVKKAERLGYWFGQVKSARIIFNGLGVTL